MPCRHCDENRTRGPSIAVGSDKLCAGFIKFVDSHFGFSLFFILRFFLSLVQANRGFEG